MKTTPSKTERLHSLDSLRAIMMLLGLVVHSAVTYTVGWDSWKLKDPNSASLVNDYIVDLIHAFRMQIFFLVAGFFGAMLFYDRSPGEMVKNRIFRVVLPFIVFVFLLWPTLVFAWAFTIASFNEHLSPLSQALAALSNPKRLVPPHFFHLWFLYYLILFVFVSVVLGLIVRKTPSITRFISITFSYIIQKPVLRLLILGSTTAVIYMIIGTTDLDTSGSFFWATHKFIYYFSFYLTGWVLFKSKDHLNAFLEYDWINCIAGVVLFTIYFFLNDSFSYYVNLGLKSLMVWFFVFGITGLFIRYASNHSPLMRYVADSSYWVYLIHLTFAGLIPGIIVNWPIPSTIKFLIVFSATGIICVVTYHYFVRATFIGKFLNGRKYSRNIRDTQIVEQAKKAT